MCKAFFAGDMVTAQKLHYEMNPLTRAMFIETNPVPAKVALDMMGHFPFEVRLPLVPLLPANREKVAATLKEAGLI